MRILWSYLRPHGWLVALALLLAAISQVLALVDPIIFGRIIDDYAINRGSKTDDELVSGGLLQENKKAACASTSLFSWPSLAG